MNSGNFFASPRICPFNKRKILEEATNIGRKGISEVSLKYNISKETIKGWKKRIKKGKELNNHGRPGPYRALSYGMKKLIQSKINFNIENYDIYEIESSHHATNFKNCEANQINTGVFSGIIEGWHGTPVISTLHLTYIILKLIMLFFVNCFLTCPVTDRGLWYFFSDNLQKKTI